MTSLVTLRWLCAYAERYSGELMQQPRHFNVAPHSRHGTASFATSAWCACLLGAHQLLASYKDVDDASACCNSFCSQSSPQCQVGMLHCTSVHHQHSRRDQLAQVFVMYSFFEPGIILLKGLQVLDVGMAAAVPHPCCTRSGPCRDRGTAGRVHHAQVLVL